MAADAAATSTNEAAIWTSAKTFSLRFAVPVMREVPLGSQNACTPLEDGSRGMNASRTAASSASPPATQSRLESMVRSSARTEYRDAYWARTATIGLARIMPRTAPALHSNRPSARRIRRRSIALAPSAALAPIAHSITQPSTGDPIPHQRDAGRQQQDGNDI